MLDALFARAIWSVLIEPGDKVAGALIDAVGPVTAARLVIDRVAPQTIADASRGEIEIDRASEGLRRWTERLRASDVMRSLESAARCGARMLVPDDAHWPEPLAGLGHSAPVLLWARGDVELLRRPGVAIVGARAATGYGEHVAMELSAGLSARDVVVVSGGAYGIDGMAHRAALASGGATIAVLAGGIDRFYPSGHEALLTRVAEHGLLLSEVPCGTPPTKWRFLQRNRLIAALSAATVVVEAGRRSGALNTANHALELGVPVGIVPGPITSAASAGCLAFLRSEPSTCVTSVAEIMQLAFGLDGVLDVPEPVPATAAAEGGDRRDAHHPSATREDPMHVRVLDALRPRRGLDPSEIARAVGESTDRIRAALGVLELEGRATLGADGHWRRTPAARERAAAGGAGARS
ncbi:DNA-processing protein DprA [Microcella humidisoli]|uniref:DNA-processing protein DprA n=1 Tax=Microcella humidisoli TaxID=2963406 RepID=A0ABY5FV77_9MICO|nr:DNA-processing protein DprA [Microcella humidisoli]UTT61805.1 DNA-processing protein DprA [Microcella humidisoli]